MSFVPEKNKRPPCPPKPIEKPLPDDKVEALRNELRLRIAALKQATIEYENKLHTLNGLAKEATSQQILDAVGNIDFSALAKDATVAKEATLNMGNTNLSALVSEERENIMGGKIDGFAATATSTQGLLIPSATFAQEPTQVNYLAVLSVDDTVAPMPFENNTIMYTGELAVGTCLKIDAYADSILSGLSQEQIAALSVLTDADDTSYLDDGILYNVTAEKIVLGQAYRLKKIVTMPYTDPEEPSVEWEVKLYVWEKADAVGRTIKEVYDKLDNLNFGPLAKEATVVAAKDNVNAHTTEERETIMGGKMVTYEEDYLPAAQYGTDNTDFRPVLIGDMDYTISEDDAFGLANGVAVGTIFRVMEDNSGDEHDMMSVPKTVDETTLTVASYDDEPTIEGITEWLNFEKDKCYIVTGVYEVADGEGDTWLVYTFEEYEPGRSGKEIYDKVDEVKEVVENINVKYATDAEYAAFKTHMQTEIANILTTITEEEE